MKRFLKFLIISIISFVVIVALFGNTEEDVSKEVEADIKTEQTSETTDKDKEEAKRKDEEKKAKEEREAKEKAEVERKQEEKKAKEEQEAKRKAKEEAQVKAEEEAQAKAEEEAEKQRKENEAKEKAEQEASDKSNAEELYLQIMRESVGSYVDIQFDKTSKAYTMTPTDQGLIDEISMLPTGIGHEGWGVLVDGMSSLSKSGKDLVGEGYSIYLVNPLNHENVILWIIDGEVIYNVIDDL